MGIPIPISLAFWASPVGEAQNADHCGKVGIVNHEFTAEWCSCMLELYRLTLFARFIAQNKKTHRQQTLAQNMTKLKFTTA